MAETRLDTPLLAARESGGATTDDENAADILEKGVLLSADSTAEVTQGETSASDGNSEHADDAEATADPPDQSCCGDQLEKMKTTSDWWSLWIGLASFSLSKCLCEYGRRNSIAFPMPSPNNNNAQH